MSATVFWQGRYTLPLAVGIPIVAGNVDRLHRNRSTPLQAPRTGPSVAIVAVGSTLAFAQNLRRYTVGYNSDVWYWLQPAMVAAASPLLLTVGYVIAVVAFVGWVLVFCQGPDRGPGEVHAEVGVPVASEPQLTP